MRYKVAKYTNSHGTCAVAHYSLSFFTQSFHKTLNRVPVRFTPGALGPTNPWTPRSRITLSHPGTWARIKARSRTQTSVRCTRHARPPCLLVASEQVTVNLLYIITRLQQKTYFCVSECTKIYKPKQTKILLFYSCLAPKSALWNSTASQFRSLAQLML